MLSRRILINLGDLCSQVTAARDRVTDGRTYLKAVVVSVTGLTERASEDDPAIRPSVDRTPRGRPERLDSDVRTDIRQMVSLTPGLAI